MSRSPRGEQVPSGWLVDAEGRPSTDPASVGKAGGALLPLGGTEGYKGTGLAAIVEILSGLLTGLGFGIDPQGRHNDGCFMAVFNVAAFRDLATFKAEVTDFAHYLKATPLAQGFTGDFLSRRGRVSEGTRSAQEWRADRGRDVEAIG